jgi:hypothetical protein
MKPFRVARFLLQCSNRLCALSVFISPLLPLIPLDASAGLSAVGGEGVCVGRWSSDVRAVRVTEM